MELSRGNLRTLGIGFKTTFEGAIKMAPSMYPKVATVVPSGTKSEDYGWLDELPGVREWLGDRVVNNLARFSYAITNRDWEETIGVDRNDILDDNLGIYAPKFAKMGRAAVAHKDQLIWPMLNTGWANLCYDGQPFFNDNHPVLDINGNTILVPNTDDGTGTPWFLIAKNQDIGPLILQVRQEYNFVSKDSPTDDNVFFQKRFFYGADARYNAGYGLWQFAWGSKQPLTPTAYANARAALFGMKANYGRPLGITEVAMYVPPTLEGAMKQILNADRNVDGSTNIWYNTAEQNVVSWLA